MKSLGQFKIKKRLFRQLPVSLDNLINLSRNTSFHTMNVKILFVTTFFVTKDHHYNVGVGAMTSKLCIIKINVVIKFRKKISRELYKDQIKLCCLEKLCLSQWKQSDKQNFE